MAKTKRTISGGGQSAALNGRPKGVILYFSEDELATLDGAASAAGFPARSHWLRKVILESARKTLRKSST